MTGLSYEMMCAAALFFCAKRAGKDRENCKRRDYRFALEPVDDLIDDIGRNKFSKTALSEGKKDGTCYSLPLYS